LPASRLVTQLAAGEPQHLVTYGCSLTAGGAWVEQVHQALAAQYPGSLRVSNSGQGAMWSRWGRENLEERVIALQPDSVLIEFSMNDAYLPYDTSVAEARQNLEAMIDGLGAALPACEVVVMVMNPPTGEHLTVRPHIEEYNEAYRQVARGRRLRLIDHWPAWQRLLCDDPDAFRLCVPDGIHPAPIGCQRIITPGILVGLGAT
jgi:lysophospholipase L1-like esterase